MKYVVGIDVRANDVSCLLVDETGAIAGRESMTFDNVATELGWSEQDPRDWWVATAASLRRLVANTNASDIVGVGLSGQLSGLVALDKDNNVVRNAILVSDERSAMEYNDILKEDGIDAVADPRREPFFPRFVQGKLLWIKNNEPQNYERIARFVMPKDYIRYMLTGEVKVNAADAEHAGFFHTEDKQWDSEIIDNVGYDIVAFPPLAPSDAPCGVVTEQASADTGLPVGLPVYGASEDSVAEYVGMNLIARGTLGIILGSTGTVATLTENVPSVAGGRLQSAVSFDGSKNMVYGVELSCVDSISWVTDAMYGEEENSNELCERAIQSAPVGSHGLVFLPYLMGERSPHLNPDAKAVFYGMSILTKGRDLVRSVVEGVVFGLHEIYELILKHNPSAECTEIVLSGIGCANDTLRHIVADVFGMPVKIYAGAVEGTAYGAALVAGTGEGLFKSMQAAEAIHRVEEFIEPDQKNHETYLPFMRVYKELYADLRKTFGHS